MSVQATTAVWNHSEAVGNERLVLLALADHAHPDGTNARPGEQTLVSMTKISARSVRDQLRSLRTRGEIVPTTKPSPGQVTEYRIVLPGLGTEAKSASDSTAADARTNGGENASQRRRERVSSPLINPMNPLNPIKFDDFWKRYPSRNGTKGSRKNALTAWEKLNASQQEKAISSLSAYARAANGYPKDAERYLRGELWDGLDVASINTSGLYRNEDEWTPAERGIA